MQGINEKNFLTVQANTLRKGQHAFLQNKPCKIVEMKTSQPGKHGPTKIVFVGLDIFTGKKYEDFCPAKHMIKVPEITKTDYQVVFIIDGKAQLSRFGVLRKSLVEIPKNDLGMKIIELYGKKEIFHVILLTSMEREAIISIKK